MNKKMLIIALSVAAIATAGVAGVNVDPKLGNYDPVKGVSGNLKSIGSDTMNNEMTLWAEGLTVTTRTYASRSKARALPQPRRP